MATSVSVSTEEKVNVDILTEFIEVSIHCILYNRNVYPQGVFEKRVKYNVPVQMCLHPDVCNYIRNVLDSLKSLLNTGTADKVSVVILDESTNLPLEKFVFEVGEVTDKWKKTDPHLFQVEQALRGILLKLNVSDALLNESSPSRSWTVHVHTKESTLASVENEFMEKDFPWTEAENSQQVMKDVRLIPLKSMKTDLFSMQLYVEEECHKS